MAKNNTIANELSVAEFLNAVADDRRRADCYATLELMKDVSGEEPRMWGTSIVGFGSYHYVYESGREGDAPLTGFSPRSKSLTLYIMAGFKRYDYLMNKLGKHRTGKSCLYINQLEDIDLDVLRELVHHSIEYMRQKYPAP